MNTPINDFLKKYSKDKFSRFHMPGHKGVEFLGVERYDITEIKGADELYNPKGIIMESENNASSLFKTAHTFYSTEGSSHCIKAMLGVVTSFGNKKILAARNVHKSFIYGAALLDLDVDWLYPETPSHICSCRVSPNGLREKLSGSNELPAAVYITSPDYLGNIQDIKGLSVVCKEFNVPLLVDNAHGAYLGFLEKSLHPIHLGATMCCDSAHKTLPVLTGGAYLHVAKNNCYQDLSTIRRMLALFASTSPSYLTLCSLDICNKYLTDDIKDKLTKVCEMSLRLKQSIINKGWKISGDEPLKITIMCQNSGYSGFELADELRKFSVEPEFSDRDVVVLMLSSETKEHDINRVLNAFDSIKRISCNKSIEIPFISTPQRKQSVRNAIFSPQETIKISDSVGRVCGAPLVSCPPAVPPVISGEVITENSIKLLSYYGLEEIQVVK